MLAANVLVGSSGSPEALTFFTGDPERFENRLLFSTEAATPGVLLLGSFDPSSLTLADSGATTYTVTPGVPCWVVESADASGSPEKPRAGAPRLVTWHPEGATALPKTLSVRRIEPHKGGRRAVLRCDVKPSYREVTLDRDGQAVFALIARSLSDNPYLRESSRAALNALIAPLEALLGTRQDQFYLQASGAMTERDSWSLSGDFNPLVPALENGGERRRRCFSVKDPHAGQHFVGDHAECVHVG